MDFKSDQCENNEGQTEIQVHQKLVIGATLIEWIGSGVCGTVYKARENRTDKIIAVKLIPIQNGDSRKYAIQEAKVHSKLKHPNIVELNAYYIEEKSLVMHMEYFNGVELSDFISNPMSDGKLYCVMDKVIDCMKRAIDYMHNLKIVHGDIQFGNVLVNANGDVKIIDFGCSHYDLSEMQRDLRMANKLYSAIKKINQ